MRVVTWNIHGAVGLGGGCSVRRIAEVLGGLDADVIGLQEVRDVPPLSRQPRALERALGMHGAFQPNLRGPLSRFGNLLLVRGEVERSASIPLPGEGEPRGLLLADVALVGGQRLTFGVTHLGLSAEARDAQKEAILDALPRDTPLVLGGDFNERPEALGALAHRLRLAAPQPSYPAADPSAAIDLVLVSAEWSVARLVAVATDASDHLPVVADLVAASPR